jgi:hypothetical protein
MRVDATHFPDFFLAKSDLATSLKVGTMPHERLPDA